MCNQIVRLKQQYNFELAKLKEMSLDFSEGSDLRFMEQVSFCKSLLNQIVELENS